MENDRSHREEELDIEKLSSLEEIPVQVIEDEPEQIDIIKLLKVFFRYWKLLIICMVIGGSLMGLLRPGTSSTVYGARATLYIPPYTDQEIDGRRRYISNNTSQIRNALGLIKSKVYQDLIAEELGAESLYSYGNYSVSRTEDTELIVITAYASNTEKAEELCRAVEKVFTDQVGLQVSINSMIEVDPVRSFTNITTTSTLRSILIGAIGGAILYTIFIIVRYFTDRTIGDKSEAEEYLGVPVLAVFPYIEDSRELDRLSK